MARNTHYYSNKKSEYRVNYLPFDYYDFWITAKENENLRFKNKLRDYLHTPFDWDENLEVYQESEAVVGAAAEAAAAAAANAAAAEAERAEKAEKARLAALARNLERLNQATQTTSRPNRHDHLKKIAQDNERQRQTEKQTQQAANLEKSVQTVINNRTNKKSAKNGRKKSKDRLNVNNGKKLINNNTRPTKSAGVQVNFEYSKKRDQATNSGQLTVAPRCQSAKYPMARNQRNQRNESSFKLDHCCDHGKEKTDANLVRSLSNMSIQTPLEWNLRDYSRTSLRSAKSIARVRSASMPRRPVERPPFANYGWAVKTKDLSQKPTHNSLANKILAVKYHDENAINELKMQRVRKDATQIANEIVSSEAKSTDRFRSDSRDWSSEYNQKYYDYFSRQDKKKRDSSLNRGPKINFYYY